MKVYSLNSDRDEFFAAVWSIINSSTGIEHEAQLAAEARADRAARCYARYLLYHIETPEMFDIYNADAEYLDALRLSEPIAWVRGTYIDHMIGYFMEQEA